MGAREEAMITRLPDWQPRLVAYIASVNRVPFDTELNNCVYFVCVGVLQMTGFDPIQQLRGRNLEEMMAWFKEEGFRDHVGYVASLFPKTKPGLALPGDLAVIPGEGGWALGFFQGDYVYAPGPLGKVLVPREEAKRAFAVGEELVR
jgi:hypothetical protein